MFRTSKLALIALSAAVLAATAYAAGGTGNDALAIVNAKVSLTEAVAVAEKHASGKAVRAEFEQSSQGEFYEIEVVSGSRVFDVKVDAVKGNVISSAEDKVDREHESEDDDDK